MTEVAEFFASMAILAVFLAPVLLSHLPKE